MAQLWPQFKANTPFGTIIHESIRAPPALAIKLLNKYSYMALSMLRAFILSLTVYIIGICQPIFASTIEELSGKICSDLLTSDGLDFRREWGVKLLRDDDPAFSDPEYIKSLQSASAPGTVSFYGWSHPFTTKYAELLKEFERYFNPGTDPNSHLEIVRFTQSGTDANNALYEMSEWAFHKRTGKKAKRANILFFKDVYGGTYGRIAEVSSRYPGNDEQIKNNFQIPSPQLKSFIAKDKMELRQVQKVEDAAISFIKKQVANDELEIGGIFIEPITAFNGVFVYRPEFMQRLRTTADELGVPIFADEILTGGGRTGTFWAFHHYKGFEPDLITFGKGLVVSGIAEVQRTHEVGGWIKQRWMWPRWTGYSNNIFYQYPNDVLDNTSRVQPLVLIQAIQVLKRIRKGQLVQNADRVGHYLIDRLKQIAKKKNLDTNVIRGVGLLLYGGKQIDQLTTLPVTGYVGRWTPPLTLTTEEVDAILAQP